MTNESTWSTTVFYFGSRPVMYSNQLQEVLRRGNKTDHDGVRLSTIDTLRSASVSATSQGTGTDEGCLTLAFITADCSLTRIPEDYNHHTKTGTTDSYLRPMQPASAPSTSHTLAVKVLHSSRTWETNHANVGILRTSTVKA